MTEVLLCIRPEPRVDEIPARTHRPDDPCAQAHIGHRLGGGAGIPVPRRLHRQFEQIEPELTGTSGELTEAVGRQR